ncbi:MAG: hypothetical protein AAFO69_10715 [Bacteroidota bacterium]
MKNSLNNTNKFLLSAASLIMAMFLSTSGLYASDGKTANGSDSAETENAAKEEAIMVEDLLNSLEEIEDAVIMETEEVATVEVYNSNDQLLMTVTAKDWQAQKATEIVKMNRKAEFLFEIDGTSIYKVF